MKNSKTKISRRGRHNRAIQLKNSKTKIEALGWSEANMGELKNSKTKIEVLEDDAFVCS